MKLKIGSVILVHGFVMLKGLDDGCKYRVQSMPKHYGIDTYQFTKARGRKVVCRHTVENIDLWIGDPRNLNRIEVVNDTPQTQ